ncbi:MAG: aromatic amino acid lyase [Planctomycetota bacterium]|nr:aromatic amino acid lyase [Planctomycetota bacterium]
MTTLDGSSLTLEQLSRIAREPGTPIAISPEALARVASGRAVIDQVVSAYVASGGIGPRVYGVTTGFGEFKDRSVRAEDLDALQENILISHAVGVGETTHEFDAANYFPPEVVRAAIVIRLNTMLQGHSGVRPILVKYLAAMLSAGVVPLVPQRGSVGSSGDLCPLAHCFVVLLGHGSFVRITPEATEPGADGARNKGERSLESSARGTVVFGGVPRRVIPGAKLHEAVLAGHGEGRELDPEIAALSSSPHPKAKEGLALSNGATFSAAMLALAALDALKLVDLADDAAALSLEAMCGRTRALDPKVHAVRNLEGQSRTAGNMLAALRGSQLADRAVSVQDPYSVRCAPQVHGASRDAIAYAAGVALAEINAATDNPLFFSPDERPCDVLARLERGDTTTDIGDTLAYSAGNFHGEPVGMAADFLAIGVAELANISERRCQLLLDAGHNRGLPAHLTPTPGRESGLMIAQYTAAGLVSENKVLCHPASVDSIPTSANSEDHNAMSTIAARKLRTVVANAQSVLAIELLIAAQAVEWRVLLGLSDADLQPGSGPRSGNQSGPAPGKPSLFGGIGLQTPTGFRHDESMRRAAAFMRDATPAALASLQSLVGEHLGVETRELYLGVRQRVAPLQHDRMLDGDIRALRRLIDAR